MSEEGLLGAAGGGADGGAAGTGQTGGGQPGAGAPQGGADLKLNPNAGGGAPPTGEPKPDGQTGQPTEYADFKFPEGIKADETLMGQFKGIAGKLGLSQENAQALIDLQAQQVLDARNNQMERYEKTFEAQQVESNKILETVGVQGRAAVQKAVRWVGGDELSKFFQANPLLSNHPVLVKAFLRIGQALSEDSYPSGAGAKSAPQTLAEAFYPNANKGQ